MAASIILVARTGCAEVLDGKDVRAWWKFETKNGGQPIGETVVPGDSIDDCSQNGVSLDVMSEQPMGVAPTAGGRALLFDGKTTWLREKPLVRRMGRGISYSEEGLRDEDRDLGPYWARDDQADYIIVVERSRAWGYVGKPSSTQDKSFIPVYKDHALTRPGWTVKRPVEKSPELYEIRTATLQLTNAFTLACWFRIGKKRENMNLLSKNDYGGPGTRSFDLGVTGAQHTRIQIFGPAKTEDMRKKNVFNETSVMEGCGGVPLDTWQFLALTFDGNLVRSYLNGNPTGKKKTPFSSMRDEPVHVTVGSNLCNHKGANIFKGGIAEMLMLGEVLSQSEIRKLYEESPFYQKREAEQEKLDFLIKELIKTGEEPR